jgi:glycosyltransferase involved in cell wall biosynthesis
MRVAFVSTGYYPDHSGGASISTRLIVDQLRDADHEVDVFTTTGNGTGLERERPDLRELPDGTASILPRRFEKNYRIVRNIDGFSAYDIVHTYGFGALPGVVLEADIPVLGTANSLEWACINWIGYLRENCPEYGARDAIRLARQDGYGPLRLPLKLLFESSFKQLAKRADRFTVQTLGMKTILNRCGYDSSKLTVVPNLLDPQFEQKGKREADRIIYVGRLTEKKGITDIVEAYFSLPATLREQFQFDVYGSGPAEDQVRDLITAEGSSVSIEYCPYEELPSVYRDAAVLVHGSKYPEPFSRTWLEALASETAIVCSENPSSTTVLDGIAEFYDPFDTPALREALSTVLTDDDRRSTMVTRGAESLPQYHPETVVKQYIDLYERIVG